VGPKTRISHGYRVSQTWPHPCSSTRTALEAQYGVTFDGFSLIWYLTATTAGVPHAPTCATPSTLIRILSLGAQRGCCAHDRRDKWIAANGGAEYDLSPAGGDLFVLGGRAQADWEHSVAKVPGGAGRFGRISGQWRWTSGTGRPEPGGSYAAPRNFSRRGPA
jgi:hypothetical protein